MPEIPPFLLERYFAKYEFNAPYLLSPSDCESLTLAETLAMADGECRGLWDRLTLSYTESSGHPLLRKEIAALYERISADEVIVAAPEEAIFIAMQTLLQPGDEVVATFPAYQSLHEIARAIGCTVHLWNAEAQDDRWRFRLDELEASLTEKTRLLVINFPHNPTGAYLSQDEFERVVEIARQRGLIVFSDEMYRGLEYGPVPRNPAMCDAYENGISLSGMSKTYAMPGLRIGWLATKQAGWLERWQIYKDYTTICSSAPSEILALIGLRSRQQIIARNLEIIQHNLEIAGSFFSRHVDCFQWLPPQAGSVAFPRWLGPGSVEEFCQGVLKQVGVMIVPASMFGYPSQYFRIGLGRRNFESALALIEGYLDNQTP